MRSLSRYAFASVAVSLAICLTANAEDAAKATAKLDGKWMIVSMVRNGKEEETLKGATRINKAGMYRVVDKDDKEIVHGSFTIEAGKNPSTMDMTPASGRYKGKKLLGIYQLDGDSLKVAFSETGTDRPTEFTGKPGVVYVIHKRSN